jgi:hypothetical protein
MITQSRFPGVMRLAQTTELTTTNQLRPEGLSGLTFDGTGLFGTGLFSSGLDVTQWGLPEFGLLGLGGYLLFAALGSNAKARRSELRKADTDYRKKREQIYDKYPLSGFARASGSKRKAA